MNDKNMEKTVQNALKAVAKQEGVSVESVRCEIEAAVAAACQNGSPAARALWESMPANGGGSLSAEDVIAFFAKMHVNSAD